MIGSRICSKCLIEKDITSFRKIKKYYKRTCIACDNLLLKVKRVARPEFYKRKTTIQNSWASKRRKEKPHIYIVQDCKKSDRKYRSEENDLDSDFVEKLINNGCVYCGETKIKITLDRIDNALSHNKNNVLPACYRCNLTRSSMPFEAWMHIVPSIKTARELGLFGSWRSQVISATSKI